MSYTTLSPDHYPRGQHPSPVAGCWPADQAPLRLREISTKRRIALASLPKSRPDVTLRALPSRIPRRQILRLGEVDRPAEHRADLLGDRLKQCGRDRGVHGQRDQRVAAADV